MQREFMVRCIQPGLICVVAISLLAQLHTAQERPPVNVQAIPIAEWLEAGETAEIPWRVNVRPAGLRMDQRLEVPYEIRIAAKDLNRSGKSHQLVFLSRISNPEGEWLNEPGII